MLDTRLKMIYDMVPQGVICDVGTDHGKLPVFALKSGRADFAYACDLREGPLSAARALVQREGLGDKVKLILSDGFADIPQSDFERVDCFVLAGMGGELIMSILSARFTDKYMVLSPQSAVYELTEFLLQGGYDIKKRTFCTDGRRIYTSMLVKYDGVKRRGDLFYGCCKSELFYEYLARERVRIQKAMAAISASQKADRSRLERLEYILSQIEENEK